MEGGPIDPGALSRRTVDGAGPPSRVRARGPRAAVPRDLLPYPAGISRPKLRPWKTAATGPEAERLGVHDCWRYLRSTSLGRLAFMQPASWT
ncbi:hypothetical protein FDW84_02590 [Pseudarthrobacter sp. NamE5]|nr:hypothetical protein FDW84_02590 [Pseudarthrobacter sp. NamE5]